MFSLSYFVFLLFKIIYLILIIVILLSWIPIFDIRKEPLASMQRFYNAVTAPFRAVIPPLGGVLDISPIFAFLALQLLEWALLNVLSRLGL